MQPGCSRGSHSVLWLVNKGVYLDTPQYPILSIEQCGISNWFDYGNMIVVTVGLYADSCKICHWLGFERSGNILCGVCMIVVSVVPVVPRINLQDRKIVLCNVMQMRKVRVLLLAFPCSYAIVLTFCPDLLVYYTLSIWYFLWYIFCISLLFSPL